MFQNKLLFVFFSVLLLFLFLHTIYFVELFACVYIIKFYLLILKVIPIVFYYSIPMFS